MRSLNATAINIRKQLFGFVLIELLISLVILVILLSFALPSLSEINQTSKDKLIAGRLLQLINQAQEEAHLRGVNIYLCGSSDGQHCDGQWSLGQIIYGNNQGNAENQQQVLAVNQIHSGNLQFHSYPRYRHELQFFPRGIITNDNATFWYCRAHEHSPRFAIRLSQFGRAQIIYSDHNNTKYACSV